MFKFWKVKLYNFLVEHESIKISRAQFMIVLDLNLKEAGIKITVARYNQILTDLGFHLTNTIDRP